MTAPISSTSPTQGTHGSQGAAPTDASADAKAMAKFEDLMGQNYLMRMQQNQQAMSKSMTKLSDNIKKGLEDDA